MPRPKKQENTNNPSSSSAKSELNKYPITETLKSYSEEKNYTHQEITNNLVIENFTKNTPHGYRGKRNFKKPNWSSKFRNKEKTSRGAKNIKTLMQEPLDNLSFNLYQSIEAGPSFMPKKKYCDITGFESNYSDPKTGLRYYNLEIFKIIQNLSEPIKNQYLALRKALFIIK